MSKRVYNPPTLISMPSIIYHHFLHSFLPLNTVQVYCLWLKINLNAFARRAKSPVRLIIIAIISAGNSNIWRGASRAWARQGQLDALAREILEDGTVSISQRAC